MDGRLKAGFTRRTCRRFSGSAALGRLILGLYSLFSHWSKNINKDRHGDFDPRHPAVDHRHGTSICSEDIGKDVEYENLQLIQDTSVLV